MISDPIHMKLEKRGRENKGYSHRFYLILLFRFFFAQLLELRMIHV